MTEYLDYYDENGNFLGKDTRENVHKLGLWHNTVHCRLYTKTGDIFFQIRKDTNTFYTTASGHVLAGETIKQAFNREIKEEIGIDIDTENAEFVNIVPWKMDKTKPDGTIIKDRAKANVYVCLYEGDFSEFKFDPNEINGLVLVNAKETLELFNNGTGKISSTIITNNGIEKKDVNISDFLVNKTETAIGKYGDILEKIISLCN